MFPGEISMEEALEAARKVAAENGKAAASWVFDGNTPEDAYALILKGIEDIDPLVMDSLPGPGFDDEFGERELCDEIDIDYDATPADEVDQIAAAYLEEAGAVFIHEVERLAREHLER